MPQFSRQRERPQRMRNRHGLTELPSQHLVLGLLVEDPIHIEMEATEIFTPEKGRALFEAANVDVGRRPCVERARVAQTDRWLRAISRKQNRLYSGSDPSRLIPCTNATNHSVCIRERSEQAEQLQPWCDGQFCHLID